MRHLSGSSIRDRYSHTTVTEDISPETLELGGSCSQTVQQQKQQQQQQQQQEQQKQQEQRQEMLLQQQESSKHQALQERRQEVLLQQQQELEQQREQQREQERRHKGSGRWAMLEQVRIGGVFSSYCIYFLLHLVLTALAVILYYAKDVGRCKYCLFGVGVDGMGSSRASRRGSIRGKGGG